MGYFLQEHDIYVGSLLDELNVRFAPPQGRAGHYGGIEEMAALQKEFKIFKKGRSFRTSISVLNIGAFNNDVKNRWHQYLDNLKNHGSNQGGQDGDTAIVTALVKNLAAKNPMPVYFTSHDMRGGKENNRVLITPKSRPVFYLEMDYLTVSVPMQPARVGKARMAAKSAKAGRPAKAKKKS
jgi:hypothetical protein